MKKFTSKTVATFLTIVLLGGCLFIGARNITRATQTGPPPCEQRIKSECIKDMPKPICPPQQERVPCPLDAIQHYVPCPLDAVQHPVPCPLDAAAQSEQDNKEK